MVFFFCVKFVTSCTFVIYRSQDDDKDWQRDAEISVDANYTYNRTEQQYSWRRRTVDDEVCLTANNSQYSSDAEVGTGNSRRNVNLVEVNTGAGHTTASGRKNKNRDSNLTESGNQATENRNSPEKSTDNLNAHSITHQNSEEDVSFSLERASSLKSVKPKTRRSKLSSSTSQSNIPGRSNSPSPSRKNTSNLNNRTKQNTNKSNRSVNVVRSSSTSESPAEFGDSG